MAFTNTTNVTILPGNNTATYDFEFPVLVTQIDERVYVYLKDVSDTGDQEWVLQTSGYEVFSVTDGVNEGGYVLFDTIITPDYEVKIERVLLLDQPYSFRDQPLNHDLLEKCFDDGRKIDIQLQEQINRAIIAPGDCDDLSFPPYRAGNWFFRYGENECEIVLSKTFHVSDDEDNDLDLEIDYPTGLTGDVAFPALSLITKRAYWWIPDPTLDYALRLPEGSDFNKTVPEPSSSPRGLLSVNSSGDDWEYYDSERLLALPAGSGIDSAVPDTSSPLQALSQNLSGDGLFWQPMPVVPDLSRHLFFEDDVLNPEVPTDGTGGQVLAIRVGETITEWVDHLSPVSFPMAGHKILQSDEDGTQIEGSIMEYKPFGDYIELVSSSGLGFRLVTSSIDEPIGISFESEDGTVHNIIFTDNSEYDVVWDLDPEIESALLKVTLSTSGSRNQLTVTSLDIADLPTLPELERFLRFDSGSINSLVPTDGSSGQVLALNGSEDALVWVDRGSGGTVPLPEEPNRIVQMNASADQLISSIMRYDSANVKIIVDTIQGIGFKIHCTGTNSAGIEFEERSGIIHTLSFTDDFSYRLKFNLDPSIDSSILSATVTDTDLITITNPDISSLPTLSNFLRFEDDSISSLVPVDGTSGEVLMLNSAEDALEWREIPPGVVIPNNPLRILQVGADGQTLEASIMKYAGGDVRIDIDTVQGIGLRINATSSALPGISFENNAGFENVMEFGIGASTIISWLLDGSVSNGLITQTATQDGGYTRITLGTLDTSGLPALPEFDLFMRFEDDVLSSTIPTDGAIGQVLAIAQDGVSTTWVTRDPIDIPDDPYSFTMVGPDGDNLETSIISYNAGNFRVDIESIQGTALRLTSSSLINNPAISFENSLGFEKILEFGLANSYRLRYLLDLSVNTGLFKFVRVQDGGYEYFDITEESYEDLASNPVFTTFLRFTDDTISSEIPVGGTEGQVLAMNETEDALIWVDQSGGGDPIVIPNEPNTLLQVDSAGTGLEGSILTYDMADVAVVATSIQGQALKIESTGSERPSLGFIHDDGTENSIGLSSTSNYNLVFDFENLLQRGFLEFNLAGPDVIVSQTAISNVPEFDTFMRFEDEALNPIVPTVGSPGQVLSITEDGLATEWVDPPSPIQKLVITQDGKALDPADIYVALSTNDFDESMPAREIRENGLGARVPDASTGIDLQFYLMITSPIFLWTSDRSLLLEKGYFDLQQFLDEPSGSMNNDFVERGAIKRAIEIVAPSVTTPFIPEGGAMLMTLRGFFRNQGSGLNFISVECLNSESGAINLDAKIYTPFGCYFKSTRDEDSSDKIIQSFSCLVMRHNDEYEYIIDRLFENQYL